MRRALIGVAAFSGALNILTLANPLFMLEIYDRVIPSRSMPTLWALILLVAGLYAFAGIFEILRGRVMNRLAGILDASLNRQVFAVIAGTPLKIRHTGDSLKPAQEADQIRSYLSGAGPAALCDLPWVPLYLAVCFFLHPLIGILAAAALLSLIALTVLTDWLTRGLTAQGAKATAIRNRYGEAAYQNAEALAAMGMTGRAAGKWESAHFQLTGLQKRATDISGTLSGISRFIRLCVQSGSLALGAYLVIQGDMTGGAIIAGSIIVARTLTPVEQVLGNWRGMLGAWQAWRKLKEVLELFPAETERTALPAPHKSLSVEGAFVAPPGTRQMTVQNVSLRTDAGSVIGIIGPSASGKSSLVRAIVGAWPLARGQVRLDGATLDQWSAGDRGCHIGYMPQSSDLFPGTVAENISRLANDAEDTAIVAAAQAAGVHEMILGLPEGYETQVGEGGTNLSAGQRQRIALARALFGNPFLVVLDEPNSNLDAEGDRALSNALGEIRKRGGIAIVVAHRNNILSLLDFLLVMEGGAAKAFGRRDEVLKAMQAQAKSRQRPSAGPNLTVVTGDGGAK